MERSCKKRSQDVIGIGDEDHEYGRVEEGKEEFCKEPPAKRQEVVEGLAGEEDGATKSPPEELGVFEFPWDWEELENDLMHAGELEAFYSSLFYSTVLGVGVVHDHLPGEERLYDGLFPSLPAVSPGEEMEDEWWATPEMEGWDCMHAGAKGIA